MDEYSSDEDQSSKKRSRGSKKYKNSLGSAAFGESGGAKHNKEGKEDKKDIIAPLSDGDIISFLNSCSNCCSLAGNLNCCLFNQNDFLGRDGVIKLDMITACVRCCRNSIARKTPAEIDSYILVLYRECLVGESCSQMNGEMVHRMQWKLQIGGATPYGPYILCRKVFAYVWGISEYKLKSAAKTIKASSTGYASNMTHAIKPWNDASRIFDSYSFNEIKDIYEENMVFDDELFGLPPPTEMVRSTLTPLALSQQHCISWMNEYFEAFGDHSPNSFDDIKLNSGSIREQYDNFYYPQAAMELESMGAKPVAYPLFTSIWKVIYPTVTNRSYCSIMGEFNRFTSQHGGFLFYTLNVFTR